MLHLGAEPGKIQGPPKRWQTGVAVLSGNPNKQAQFRPNRMGRASVLRQQLHRTAMILIRTSIAVAFGHPYIKIRQIQNGKCSMTARLSE